MGIRILYRVSLDAVPDPMFYPDADADPSFQIKDQPLKSAQIGYILYILVCHLQVYADPDPDFYWMRIRVLKIMWIRIHNAVF